MNELNRFLIVLVACVLIVLMAIVIFLVWTAPDDAINELQSVVDFLRDNNETAGQLIVTLGALTVIVLALLMIIVELAPEDEPKELRVEQAGATTVIPADALRLRLEEALLNLPEVTAARARVKTRDGGIASNLELTVTPHANLAGVTQEATRVVVDAVQTDLGLPVAGVPSVKFTFGGSKVIRGDTPAAGPPEPSPPVLAPLDPPAPTPAAVDEIGEPAPSYPPAEPPATTYNPVEPDAPVQSEPPAEPAVQSEPPAEPAVQSEPPAEPAAIEAEPTMERDEPNAPAPTDVPAPGSFAERPLDREPGS